MSESTHVTRLFGGPGSGKTTALLDRVDEMLEAGVDVRDVLVVSYTRAAATEVRERLADRLDRSPKSLRGNVCTMHAKAYELLNLSRGDVVGEDEKEAFCEEYGLEFEDEYKSARRRSVRWSHWEVAMTLFPSVVERADRRREPSYSSSNSRPYSSQNSSLSDSPTTSPRERLRSS